MGHESREEMVKRYQLTWKIAYLVFALVACSSAPTPFIILLGPLLPFISFSFSLNIYIYFINKMKTDCNYY